MPEAPAEPCLEYGELGRRLLLPPQTPFAIVDRTGGVAGAPVGDAKAVLVYTHGKRDVERAAQLSLSPDAYLWIAYPSSTPRTETALDVVAEALRVHELEPTLEVTLDRRWSAVLARPATPRTPMFPRALRLARRAAAMAARVAEPPRD